MSVFNYVVFEIISKPNICTARAATTGREKDDDMRRAACKQMPQMRQKRFSTTWEIIYCSKGRREARYLLVSQLRIELCRLLNFNWLA